MAKISLKDIAEKVGVSTATVSLVLNGKEKTGRIGKEIAEKIRLAAKEMNYEPNNLARGLRIGRSNTIALIVADISNTFFANLAFHIQEYAEKFGYTVIITNTNESTEKMGKVIATLKSRQVDGFIIVPTEEGEKYIGELQKAGSPIVLLDRYFPGIPICHVVVNNYHASYEGTKLLIESGCKNIGLLIYKNQLPHIQDRKRGYTDALLKAGIFQPDMIKEIHYESIQEDIMRSIDELAQGEHPADGIFFATNTISMSGIKRLLQLNKRIPEDIRVVCFDKNEAFEFSKMPIPCIQQPIPEMGRMAVDILIEQIKEKKAAPVHIELYATLLNDM